MFSDFGINIPTPDTNEIVEVTKKKIKKEPFPGYTMWGNGKATKYGGKSMDIIDIFKELGKPEMILMQFFRDEMLRNRNSKEDIPNILVPTKSEEYTPYIKVALKKHYAHMECLGIVKRIKRGKYMLNPRLFIPPKDIEKIATKWDLLDKTNCDETENK